MDVVPPLRWRVRPFRHPAASSVASPRGVWVRTKETRVDRDRGDLRPMRRVGRPNLLRFALHRAPRGDEAHPPVRGHVLLRDALRLPAPMLAAAVVALALAVYAMSASAPRYVYDHFVWQAAAWLE